MLRLQVGDDLISLDDFVHGGVREPGTCQIKMLAAAATSGRPSRAIHKMHEIALEAVSLVRSTCGLGGILFEDLPRDRNRLQPVRDVVGHGVLNRAVLQLHDSPSSESSSFRVFSQLHDLAEL